MFITTVVFWSFMTDETRATISYYCTFLDLGYVQKRVDFVVDHLRRTTDYLAAMQTVVASSSSAEDGTVDITSRLDGGVLEDQFQFRLSSDEVEAIKERARRYHFNGSLTANVISTQHNGEYQTFVHDRFPDLYNSRDMINGHIIVLTVPSREDIRVVDHLLRGLLIPEESQHQVKRLVPLER